MTLISFNARLTNQFDSVFIDGAVQVPEKQYDIRVSTSRTRNAVVLRDGKGLNKSVFLEGMKASCFFADLERFGKEQPHITVIDALRILAEPHVQHWK